MCIRDSNYTVPNYISPGAARLIRKMLQVNPVSRITIQEIRQDPWFTKDLAEYLQPPVEEFLDTGVDPNRAIDPKALAPNKPAVVQEQLHDTVVGKLGTTMGYAKVDVQDALSKDEPSAIKDAYLIVRENTIMKTNRESEDGSASSETAETQPATVNQNPDLQRFLAQSPPAYGSPRVTTSSSSPTKRPSPSPLGQSTGSAGLENPRQNSSGSANAMEGRSPATTIGVLPSSLPSYHQAYMQGHKPALSESKPMSPTMSNEEGNGAARDPVPKTQTSEERAATARRLNPHARGSQVNAPKVEKPEGLTPIPTKEVKKTKQTKWQFGIRSRNSPSEAMLAIYKALRSMGAVWEVAQSRKPGGSAEGSPGRDDAERERQRRAKQRQGSQSPEYSDSDPDAGTDPEYATGEERDQRRARGSGRRSGSSSDTENKHASHRDRRRKSRGRDRFGQWNDWGYDLPEDPWIINARFKKDGMFPPGVIHPSSTQSSRVDLTEAAMLRRRSSTMGSQSSLTPNSNQATPPLGTGSTNASTENMSGYGSLKKGYPNNNESVWVYVTIQLYCIERDSFMVDFKLNGYEGLVRKLRREVKKNMSGEDLPNAMDEETDSDDDMDEGMVGVGRITEEKDITSPFPFMDVASSLIVSLAQRD